MGVCKSVQKNKMDKEKDKSNFHSASEFYDIIIDLKSLVNLTNGITITIKDKANNLNEKFKTKNSIVLGVMGLFKKGKTFILSKLCSY